MSVLGLNKIQIKDKIVEEYFNGRLVKFKTKGGSFFSIKTKENGFCDL
jgi:hypothetical protein